MNPTQVALSERRQSPHRGSPSPITVPPNDVALQVVPQHEGPAVAGGQMTMPFIKRHVTRRLRAAKITCDQELARVISSITAYFEEKMRESEREREREREEREREEREREREERDREEREREERERTDTEDNYAESALRKAVHQLQASVDDDVGYEAEVEGRSHSRQASTSSSPSSFRRSNMHLARSTTPGRPDLSPARKQTPILAPIPTQPSANWKVGEPSRRLSRGIHIPTMPTRSGGSSRSTSRSRSPLPPTTTTTTAHGSFTESGVSSASPHPSNRRMSRLDLEPPTDPFMTTLHEITTTATDIIDMSIASLTSKPKACLELVQKVQGIGKAWDDHPDWPGRSWYVQLLLAVASLSRIAEWWEAEKQFWNFADEDEEVEPLTFVLKPEYEQQESSMPDLPRRGSMYTDDDNPLRLTRPASQGRRSRDERVPQKDIGGTRPEPLQPVTETSPEHNAEMSRVQAAEHLQHQAEKAQSLNIFVELALDGERLQYISRAWADVVGTDPESVVHVGLGFSTYLAPEDANVFKEASKRLQDDDSHTVQFTFNMRVEPEGEYEPNTERPLVYREMEAMGMLMHDRIDGEAKYTMWVIKPIGEPKVQEAPSTPGKTALAVADEDVDATPQTADLNKRFEPTTPFPFQRPILTTSILCRICECEVPDWFFEKHNETCNEVHRLEADIGESNESISELRNTIRDLMVAVDKASPLTVPEYRGLPIFSPGSTPSPSSPIQAFRPPLASRMQRVGVRKAQQRLLESLDEILQVAWEIGIPCLKEDEAHEPIERQRLMSPGSEGKVSQVRRWSKPIPDDPALSRLVQDVDLVMKTKMDNVTRMQNTVRYSEKVRQEWEEKVEEMLHAYEERRETTFVQQQNEQQHEDDEQGAGSDGEASSTTSEYAFGRDPPNVGPAPVTSSSPTRPNGFDAFQSPRAVPQTYQGVGLASAHTRSSTPSSVSSPLALAQPINASGSDPVPLPEHTVRNRKSMNLDPRLLGTPPVSPVISPKQSRRHSIVHLSPTVPGATLGASNSAPLSPRLPSLAPTPRTTPSSIKDFEIIKPISKGAFGSVFLAKKKITGDYFAIKVLKKADMIAKNQITNVKAERMILMKQAESPYVVKLFFTFQSKDNLYLVMEYLNGGDCAALIKSLGNLPEEWTRSYIAEVVLGLEYLHERGVVHRDLKPDNLLIDQHGHLKLTDFGLSRIGLLGRQTRDTRRLPERAHGPRGRVRQSPGSRPTSFDSAYLSSPLITNEHSAGGSYFNPRAGSAPHLTNDEVSESSGSESLSGMFRRKVAKGESPLQSFATELTAELRNHSHSAVPSGGGTPPAVPEKFVGTPDYLAPESILGISEDDRMVDWWALGVITYEFLLGIPPFHAETPEKVFENILSRNIDWHEDWIEVSADVRDFMERLMCIDPKKRLGAYGAKEVRNHPFLRDIDWDNVTKIEAQFVPQVTDPESTDYFDPRGAIPQLFHDDEAVAVTGRPTAELTLDDLVQSSGSGHAQGMQPATPASALNLAASVPVAGPSSSTDDGFGAFMFKNLPVLKQANDDMIKKMRTDQLAPMLHTLTEPVVMHDRRRSLSQRIKKPSSLQTNIEPRIATTNPPSPSTSTSSLASSPSRGSMPPPGAPPNHIRRPSEYSAVERFKVQLDDGSRRNSMPSRLRTASVSSSDQGYSADSSWPQTTTPPSSVASSGDMRKTSAETDRAVTCLVAEDNPISSKIMETLLTRMGCRVIVVADGAEAISVALGEIKFDCILMDYQMPVVDGEGAAKYIKATNNLNKSTPIIAVSAYSSSEAVASNLFAASLAKPVSKSDLLTVLRQLGFKMSSSNDGGKAKAI